jgi:hypothetical protein
MLGIRPRLTAAFLLALTAGLTWSVGTARLRWNREPHPEALRDGAILGSLTFVVTFSLALLTSALRKRPPRVNSN